MTVIHFDSGDRRRRALESDLRMIAGDTRFVDPRPSDRDTDATDQWITDAEADILGDLRRAEAGFWNLPEDKVGERAAFREHIAQLEDLVVMRLARRTACEPVGAANDETERHLRAIAAAERRERIEAHVTAFAILGISTIAAIAVILRVLGVGA